MYLVILEREKGKSITRRFKTLIEATDCARGFARHYHMYPEPPDSPDTWQHWWSKDGSRITARLSLREVAKK